MTLKSGGDRQLFKATGKFSDGNVKEMRSGEVTWSSSATNLVTIDSSGMATTVTGSGTATITAADPNNTVQSDPVTITVLPPVLKSITIDPPSATIVAGSTQQFKAMGVFSDNSSKEVTTEVIWSSSPETVVKVIQSGLASGESDGSASIKAADPNNSSVWASADLTVTAAGAPGKLDPSKVTVVDMRQFREDLKTAMPEVEAATDAKSASEKAASDAGVTIDNPSVPAGGMKGNLTDQQKTDLRQDMETIKNTWGRAEEAAANIKRDLKLWKVEADSLKKPPGAMSDDFWKALENKLGTTGIQAEHVEDGSNQIWSVVLQNAKDITTGSWVSAIIGMDLVKDLVKDFDDDGFVPLKGAIDELGRMHNLMLRQMGEQALGKIPAYKSSVEEHRVLLDKAEKDYEAEMANYTATVSKLSGGTRDAAATPFAQAYLAVLKAGKKSAKACKDIRATTLDPNSRVPETNVSYYDQLDPLGNLIAELPAGQLGRAVIVYEKSGKQYGYRDETQSTMQNLPEQLEKIKTVYDSDALVQQRVDKWNAAMTSQ
jgi:hypothetical protein